MSARIIIILIAISCAIASSACASWKSTLEIPPCADRVELQGEALRLGPRRFELDHTLDLPFSRTALTFERDGKVVHTSEIVSAQPDALRLFVGAGLVGLGGLLVGASIYEVALGQAIFSERPLFAGLFGAGALAGGAGMMSTGWHPSQRTISLPEVVCR